MIRLNHSSCFIDKDEEVNKGEDEIAFHNTL
jgi:hypothetical protein